MTYELSITEEVKAAVRAQMAYFRDQGVSESRLDGWITGLYDVLDSLCEWPRRHAAADLQLRRSFAR